ncbi:Hvo_1808 family surface protein [Halospeciosus flavus]|uniref:Hvo_1808 family surface protein n=1 Tax=Halospeciosus flavus TaxID=3032283 RepID=UPI0036121EE2
MRRHVAALLVLGVLVALAGCTAPTDLGLSSPTAPPDPAEDTLGWEQGYWHNESLPVTTANGLNQSELNAVVGRSMARVEHLRHLEFEKRVPVEVISRQQYRTQYAGGGNASSAIRTFDNAKFEALLLVGETGDSLDQQSQNRGSSVLGFYSPSADRIVIISESETPAIQETTLGHELVHAAQFRTFEMGYEQSTRDEANAVSGLIEGDASYVDHLYSQRCGQEWSCVSPPAKSGGEHPERRQYVPPRHLHHEVLPVQ